jgi:hypothetical protein
MCAWHVSGKPVHGGVYSIQHFVIKFVSDLRQIFIWVFRFPPPRYNWNIVQSGVKHHKSIDHVSGITFFFCTLSQKVGKPNYLGAIKPKWLNKIAKIGSGLGMIYWITWHTQVKFE